MVVMFTPMLGTIDYFKSLDVKVNTHCVGGIYRKELYKMWLEEKNDDQKLYGYGS